MGYTPDIDISELITLQDTMASLKLGPNGGLIYCMEYLEANLDWLVKRMEPFIAANKYLLLDCPGQIELYTVNNALRNILDSLSRKQAMRMCVVNLVDAHYCIDPAKYVAMLLVSLKTMIQLEMPHINVLSKMDLMKLYYAKMDFGLDFYSQVQDLGRLLERLNEDAFTKRYKKLNAALCELVEDFGLVGFHTLCIEDKESVVHLSRAIDKANGYIYGALESSNESIFAVAEQADAWERHTREMAEAYLEFTDPSSNDLEDIVIAENSFPENSK